MKRGLLLPLFLLCWPLVLMARPQLDLDVRLDPATRLFEARAILSDPAGLEGFNLGRDFEITKLRIDGHPARPARRLAGADFGLPPGTRQVEIVYRGSLQPTPSLDHRQVLGQRRATAAPAGSFLPASAGWYPDPGRLFSYRVDVRVPPGQKAVATGNFVTESETAEGYHAQFAFPEAADGINLMAGPYQVSERLLKLGGRTIRVRTWFHPELAEHAPAYLEDAARYIARYSALIGDYPFDSFGIVSSPTPTGFGMPGLTYLGRVVIRLPFIRATSLGHEVLHNWWGNGVYPDWRSGNWSEGLTTFLADYAYKEDEGPDAAREMRLGWLRDLIAVPPEADGPLKEFTSRHHGIASIIGYNKAAMVFLMLRDKIGTDAFERGLRLFWERHKFQIAGWQDLEAAFSTASGQSLAGFFDTWVNRPGAPEFTPQQIAADTDFRLWRRLDPAIFPPILRETFVAPRAVVVRADAVVEAATALALAQRTLDAKPRTVADTLPAREPALIVGLAGSIDAWLARHGLAPRPVAARGSAQVWAGRDGNGRPYVIVAARDNDALQATARGLPHHGKQSWLIFEGARVTERAVLPPRHAMPTAASP